MRSAIFAVLLMACSSSSEAMPTRDAGSDASDSSGDTISTPASCNFNDECPADRRCDCAERGCTCEVGPRGTGKAGVDACTTGLDCISGLCVEGASGSFCSGRCTDGCGDKLPRCSNISPLGEICVREPPAVPTGAKGTFGANTFEFAHAFFGYDYGDSGPIATVIEVHAGWSGGCPPPKTDPDATIVVTGVPLPFATKQYETGIKATLLGFASALPIKSSATSAKLEITAIEKCPTDVCALQLGVSFTFAEGAVNGSVRALHCDSLDLR